MHDQETRSAEIGKALDRARGPIERLLLKWRDRIEGARVREGFAAIETALTADAPAPTAGHAETVELLAFLQITRRRLNGRLIEDALSAMRELRAMWESTGAGKYYNMIITPDGHSETVEIHPDDVGALLAVSRQENERAARGEPEAAHCPICELIELQQQRRRGARSRHAA